METPPFQAPVQTPPGENPHGMVRRALTLGKGAMASRLLGLVRELLFAAILGVGGVADAVLLAFRLPGFCRRLMSEGSLGYAFIPAYTRLGAGPDPQQGQERADRFARSCIVWLFLLVCLAALAGILFSDALTLALAPGLYDRPETRSLAAFLLALCLPYLPLAAGAAFCGAVLLAKGRFFAPAMLPVIMNAALVAGCLIVLVPGFSVGAPTILCLSLLAGGALQGVWLVWGCAGSGFRLFGPCSLRDPEALAVLSVTPAAAFGASQQQVIMLAAACVASFLPPGGIAALYFAERLMDIPIGLIGSSLGLATLTELSATAVPAPGMSPGMQLAGRPFRQALGTALHLALFFGVPAALGLAALAVPLTTLLFGRGAFDAVALAATSRSLTVLAVGLPAMMAAKPLLAALGALNDRKGPLYITLAGTVLVLAGGWLLLDGVSPYTAAAPALAVSLSAWLILPLLFRALARHGALPVFSFHRLLSLGAGALALAAFLIMMDLAGLRPAFHVPLAGGLGVALYIGVALACKSPDARLCLELARKDARQNFR